MDPIQRALAELRAITTSGQVVPESEQTPPACCNGERTGYQWHIRNKIPACETSKQAAAAYMRERYDRTGRYAGWKRERAAAGAKRAA